MKNPISHKSLQFLTLSKDSLTKFVLEFELFPRLQYIPFFLLNKKKKQKNNGIQIFLFNIFAILNLSSN